MSIPRAVLDSDIIFSRVLHELFGLLASTARLIDLYWSDELIAEAKRALIERKPLTTEQAERWVGHLQRECADGRVELATAALPVELASLTTDRGDEHICALALAAHANYLIASDRGYLQSALAEHGVQVLSPDTFLSELIGEEPAVFYRILLIEAGSWAGGKGIEELIDAIEHAGCPRFAVKARELFSGG